MNIAVLGDVVIQSDMFEPFWANYRGNKIFCYTENSSDAVELRKILFLGTLCREIRNRNK